MSSLKFSYWSSPNITTTSGLKSTSRARAAAAAPQSSPNSSRNGAGQLAGSFIAAGMSGSASAVRIMPVQSSLRRSISGRCVHPKPRISAIFFLPLPFGLRLIARATRAPPQAHPRKARRGARVFKPQPATRHAGPLPALFDRNVVPLVGAHEQLSRAHQLGVGVFEHLLPLRDPPDRARDREQCGEHGGREANGFQNDPRIEIDVGIQFSRDEIIVA